MLYFLFFFFFNDTATPEIHTYQHTLSLHDALPIEPRQNRIGVAGIDDALRFQHFGVGDRTAQILPPQSLVERNRSVNVAHDSGRAFGKPAAGPRSEEHTSELQSLMSNSSAVLCLKTKRTHRTAKNNNSI